MPGKMSDLDIMPENIMTSGGYAGEDEDARANSSERSGQALKNVGSG